MARARLLNTGKATKRPQPKCNKCGEVIEPGTRRWEWSFRYGGTYTRHENCGAPRPSELTQGMVGGLYAAQEAIEDAVGLPCAEDSVEAFDAWKADVSQALSDAAEVARDLAGEYEAAAEPFGGEGENGERAESCNSWADALEDAASNVDSIEVDLSDVPDESEDDESEDDDSEDDGSEESREEKMSEAIENARGEVESAADDGSSSLEL